MTKSGKHCVKRRNCSFFKKLSAVGASESVYMRERVKKNIVVKIEISHDEQILLLLQCSQINSMIILLNFKFVCCKFVFVWLGVFFIMVFICLLKELM